MNSLLYATSVPITDNISVIIPTIGQIMNDEDAYYGAISAITATPSDYMVQLNDLGIDYSTLSSYELFLLLFNGLKTMDTSLIFGDLDLSKFKLAAEKDSDSIVLIDTENDIVIDKQTHAKISRAVCKINGIEKQNKKPGNEEAKKYLISRARIKQNRASKKEKQSQLEGLIISMVNTEQYKYDYNGTLGLSIYQFNASVYQIIKKINYDNTMIGCYAGTVSMKDLNKNDLNWLSSSK